MGRRISCTLIPGCNRTCSFRWIVLLLRRLSCYPRDLRSKAVTVPLETGLLPLRSQRALRDAAVSSHDSTVPCTLTPKNLEHPSLKRTSPSCENACCSNYHIRDFAEVGCELLQIIAGKHF